MWTREHSIESTAAGPLGLLRRRIPEWEALNPRTGPGGPAHL